ncbi:MAG: hypothetical protein ACREBU_09880 [Nitrososphaera sp.]
MKLDNFQKQEFFEYWGNCPLIDTIDKKMVYVDRIEHDVDNRYLIFGSKFKPELDQAGNQKIEKSSGLAKIAHENWECVEFDNIEPLFLDSGYYQIGKFTTGWLTRRPDRSRIKGMNRHNSAFIYIEPINDKMKELVISEGSPDSYDWARIYYGVLPNYRKSLDEHIARLNGDISAPADGDMFISTRHYHGDGWSIALSKNVALVKHITYDIPVVLYKLRPVGWYHDRKILISRKKIAAKETVEEETNLPVKVYGE